MERRREQGHVYEHEGAIWLRTTDFGDDKDRVLRRSNGEKTYFAADIAYHEDKRERGDFEANDIYLLGPEGWVQMEITGSWKYYYGWINSPKLVRK